jgi:RNA polymerase sigma-70 factor (ECF subfamily)
LKKSFWHKKTEPFREDWPVFSDTHSQVMEEVLRLPTNYRNVIYLRYYEGYTIAEIAKILGKNENTVSSWATRAKKSLKNLILDGGNENEQRGLHQRRIRSESVGRLETGNTCNDAGATNESPPVV